MSAVNFSTNGVNGPSAHVPITKAIFSADFAEKEIPMNSKKTLKKENIHLIILPPINYLNKI